MFAFIFAILTIITPAPAPVDLDNLQGSSSDQDEWSDETPGGACKLR